MGTPVLEVKDSADTFRSLRWEGDDGTPYALTSGSLVVRETEDSEDALLEVEATLLGAPDHWAQFRILKADIVAAGFDEISAAVWEAVLVRTVDGASQSTGVGVVEWT